MENIDETELVDAGVLPPDNFSDAIERIKEISKYELRRLPDLLDRLKQFTAHLLIDEEKLISIASALISGNLVLQGPPGTGKSSLALAIARAFNCNLYPVTAHEEWSTYELIGRQTIVVGESGREQVLPVNGHFTESVIECANSIVKNFDNPDEPQATWLFIDELNRCHVDRAFGELFSLLGTSESVSVNLSHQTEGNRSLVTPNRFRIIGTINSIDRQFVNSLSQAIRRRFIFVSIDIPPKKGEAEEWSYTEVDASLSVREYQIVIKQAAQRIASRGLARFEEVENLLSEDAATQVKALFNMVELVRYSEKETKYPFLPIGTAQLIDVLELFSTRIYTFNVPPVEFNEVMDWATSLKLAPLFEADTITPLSLDTFADNLKKPFNNMTKHEIKQIAAAGMFFVN
jgi:MoxR-like ATPase